MNGTRIGIVRRGYSVAGGAERYLGRFAAALAERGHQVVLFASPDWPDQDERFREIRRIPGDDPISFADRLAKEKPRDHCDLLYSFERVWDCDIYRAGDGVHRAWLDRRAKREPLLRTLCRKASRKHRQILQLEEVLFSAGSPARIVANSEMVKFEIQSYYGKQYERIRVIYNGYKPPATAGDPRTAIRENLGLRDHEVMLLFSGSGWERKGLKVALAAAKSLRSANVRLVVAGKGNPRTLPPGEALFVGAVADMPSFFEAADIFVLPSLYDPFSNACLEAAAHGLPVITTLANGFSEILLHGVNGDVIEDPGDVDGLTEAIRRWLPPARRKREREKIRAWARGYHVSGNVDHTMEFITGGT